MLSYLIRYACRTFCIQFCWKTKQNKKLSSWLEYFIESCLRCKLVLISGITVWWRRSTKLRVRGRFSCEMSKLYPYGSYLVMCCVVSLKLKLLLLMLKPLCRLHRTNEQSWLATKYSYPSHRQSLCFVHFKYCDTFDCSYLKVTEIVWNDIVCCWKV